MSSPGQTCPCIYAIREMDIYMTVKSKITKRVVGCPRSSRERFIEAAVALLKERGVAFSLEDVAAITGRRRQTIYNHFGSKEALLREAVLQLRDELVLPFKEMEGSAPLVLRTLAEAVMAHFFKPENIRVQVLLSAAAYEIPGFSEWIRPRVEQPLNSAIVRYLQSQVDDGLLSISNPRLASQIFLGSLTGFYSVRVMHGEALPDLEQQRRHIDEVLTTFLTAWGYAPVAQAKGPT